MFNAANSSQNDTLKYGFLKTGYGYAIVVCLSLDQAVLFCKILGDVQVVEDIF